MNQLCALCGADHPGVQCPKLKVTDNPADLTPVENRNGRLYKREDLFRFENGVNGSKLRACHYLVSKALWSGATTIVSAASVLSPQSAMAATIANRLGMDSITVVGGTTPEKAVRHQSIRMAKEMGSFITSIKVGYNPALQSEGRRIASETPGRWQLPYGITTPPDASEEEILDFVCVGANQVWNIPDEVETLVLPFGSGNTAMGVLYGLLEYKYPRHLQRIVLMTIGPDRAPWLETRMETLGRSVKYLPLEQVHLHPNFATYGDRMPETDDDIVFHPTYEGKIIRYLNGMEPDWWRRDDKTMLWVVGGPLP